MTMVTEASVIITLVCDAWRAGSAFEPGGNYKVARRRDTNWGQEPLVDGQSDRRTMVSRSPEVHLAIEQLRHLGHHGGVECDEGGGDLIGVAATAACLRHLLTAT